MTGAAGHGEGVAVPGGTQAALTVLGCGQQAHEHDPQPGTIYTSSGLPVERTLDRFSSYPVDAVCRICEQPIRRGAYLAAGPEGDWQLKYPEGTR